MTRRANGEGSVSERKDGRWEGAAYVLLADGTYARRRVYGRTRQEASRRLTEIVSRSQAGLPADATEWTVERFLAYWLEQVVNTCLFHATVGDTAPKCTEVPVL